MSLQSIIDATPIVSWRNEWSDEWLGSSHKHTYSVHQFMCRYYLYWFSRFTEEPSNIISGNPQEIIDKINELEGVKS